MNGNRQLMFDADGSVRQVAAVMNEAEARICIERIKESVAETRRLLFRLYDERGWEVLGYSSWEACVVAEFGNAQAVYLHRQLNAARAELNIQDSGELPRGNLSDIGVIPEFQLRPLTSLPSPDLQREVWQAANETAPPSGLTGRHVESVVKAVRERMNAGQTAAEAVREVVQESRLPTPAEAREIAKETGLLVAASDGYYHDDTTADQREQVAAQSKRMYSGFDALAALAHMDVSAQTFARLVRPDQAYHINDNIDAAYQWLKELKGVWACR